MNVLSGIRNHRKVRPHFTALERRGFPSQPALKFAQGYLALSAYPAILSESGRQLLAEANTLMASSTTASHESTVNQFVTLLPQFPSVANPRLGLYVSPSSAVTSDVDNFMGEHGAENITVLFEITEGCYLQCLDCTFDPPSKMVHMPYPMVLASAQEILVPMSERHGKFNIQTYYRSDMMHYADRYWDADFGDVAIALIKEMGLDIDLITHGWASGDRYAGQAALKLFEAGIRASHLSINLLHRQLQRNPDKVEEFVARFRLAIKLLRPNEIRLKGVYVTPSHLVDRYELSIEEPEIPEVFSWDYLEQLFNERIAPEGFSGKIHQYQPYYEGRARSMPGAKHYAPRSIIHYPRYWVRFTPSGRCILEQSKRVPEKNEGAAKIGEIFSGPNDLRFKTLIYLLLDLISSRPETFALEDLKHENDPLYFHALKYLSRFVRHDPELDDSVFNQLSEKDFHDLFNKLKDLSLPFRLHPTSGLSFEDMLQSYWDRIKHKHSTYNNNFYCFFLECLNMLVYGNSEVLDREDLFIMSFVFKELLPRRILGADYKEKVRRLFNEHKPDKPALEDIKELYENIKDLPICFGLIEFEQDKDILGGVSANSVMPIVETMPQIRPIASPVRLFPDPFQAE